MAPESAGLAFGTRLGPYEVVSPVGSGGMGEVYRAKDTRLGRLVAVKVLPREVASDPDRRKRFEREARAVAALSHPSICTVFDVGREETPTGPVDYLVMELLEGETLAQRLRKGPMPTDRLLKVGIEIASALDKAHRAGVVHRDVKPGNIVLTKAGAKLLDFGLARLRPMAASLDAESAAVTEQETRDDSLTDEGQAMGTYPYMAPEQLEGKAVDARADLFALGAVLYEMAAGRRAFEGTSQASIAVAILTSDPPPITSLRPVAPVSLERLVRALLARDPDARIQSAHDVEQTLTWIAESASEQWPSPGLSEGGGHPRSRRLVAGGMGTALVAGLIGLAALGIAGVLRLKSRSAEPRISAVRSVVRVQAGINGLETDGANVYYAELTRPTNRLMAVSLAGGPPREIALPWRNGLNLAVLGLRREPVELLLRRETELWRLPLPQGAPQRLARIPRVVSNAAAWSREGDRLAWIEQNETSDILYVGDADGGNRRSLVEVSRRKGESTALLLMGWAPGDERVRYARGDHPDEVFDVPSKGGTPEMMALSRPDVWGSPEWSPGGRQFLLGTTTALRAFPEGRDWLGRARPPRSLAAPSHVAWMRFTPGGDRLVAFVNVPGTQILRLEPSSKALVPLLGGMRAGSAHFSPDGLRMAWVSLEGVADRLWLSRPDGTEAIQLSELDVLPGCPMGWSPDGRRIAFPSRIEDGLSGFRLYLATPEEGGVELLVPNDANRMQITPCWSPDGKWLVYGSYPVVGGSAGASDADLYLRRVDLATRAVTKLEGSDGLWSPACSQDGRILAFDEFARRTYDIDRKLRDGQAGRWFFKLRDPTTGGWAAFSVAIPAGSEIGYANWSRDGRYVYANLSVPRSVVRFDVSTRRLETVFTIEGLGEGIDWIGLDPAGAPLVQRDVSQREILVMNWEER